MVCSTIRCSARRSCRRFLVRPGRRPRRYAAAGAPPGPAPHRPQTKPRRPTAKNGFVLLPPAPVFIESPATTTFTTTTCGGSNVASTRFFAWWRDQRSVSTSSTSTRNSGASSRVEDRTVGRPGVGDGDVAGSVHSFPAVRVVAGGSWRCYPPTEGLATYWCELTKSRSLFCGQSRSSQVVHLHHAAKGRK
jgi:hypothetical protein